ncbi:MAG: MarR family transcriptional regulator [Anaerolineae bacterium]|nr:MarR family transcriptional regulator [Anaerolineae bacterium]
MEDTWNARTVAQRLINIMPRFNRAIIHAVQYTALDDDVTMMQVFTLVALIEEPMTASELAKRRNVSLQSVSTLTQALVEKGWLTRVRKPDDRRQYLLQPTPEGIAQAEATKKQITEYAALLLNGLSEDELEAAGHFIPALERIVTNLASGDHPGCR